MLELKNISFRVDDREILKDINFSVDKKKIVVITGPNGGGKSTLAKIVVGIQTPSSGQILFNGEDITGLSITDRSNLGISYAFQQPVRFKGFTVSDLICLAAKRELRKDELCDYLCDVGLCANDYMDREVNASLSGGEIKRVEIAMTMARKAQLNIFDEPEAGIDLWSFNNLIDVFQRLREQSEGSIIIISHQERILDIADEIIVLSNGSIVNVGSKSEILPDLISNGHCAFFPGMSRLERLGGIAK